MAPGHERIDAIVPLVASRHARAAIHAAWRAAWATRSEPCRTLLRNSIFYHCRPPCRGCGPGLCGAGAVCTYARGGMVVWEGQHAARRRGPILGPVHGFISPFAICLCYHALSTVETGRHDLLCAVTPQQLPQRAGARSAAPGETDDSPDRSLFFTPQRPPTNAQGTPEPLEPPCSST